MDDLLAEMRQEFLAHAAALFAEIGDHLARAQEATEPSGDYFALVRAAHSLKGCGGTFGFPDLTERAAEVERLGRDEPIESSRDGRLAVAIRALGACLPSPAGA